MRELVSETTLAAQQLIMPHFVLPDPTGDEPIASMPGIRKVGVDRLLGAVEADLRLGIRTVLLFGYPDGVEKSAEGRAAAEASSATIAIAALKQRFGQDLLVISDVCLCAYTDHGHCGLLGNGRILNDESLAALSATAVAHARAGVDVVAPSDMMDGRVAAIRDALDDAGYSEIAIMSYAVKYASAYYGPFREAANSAPAQGDRRSYQMDPRNSREALREAELDIVEGADFLMVKPALAYLDIVNGLRRTTNLPIVAYNVSGEYSAVKAAAANGWLSEADIVRENLYAMRRAGADQIITYHARDALKEGWLL
jgi:porphobilinogen synthase